MRRPHALGLHVDGGAMPATGAAAHEGHARGTVQKFRILQASLLPSLGALSPKNLSQIPCKILNS